MRFLRPWSASVLVLLAAVACHRQPAADNASRFAPTPPTIDGRDDDWENDLLVYDATSKLQYRIANDQRNVYVRVKAADQATQMRLLTQGFTVWLDTTGRSQQQFGVRYPLGRQPGERGSGAPGPRPTPDGTFDRESRLKQFLVGMNEMELLNYKGSKEPVLTDTKSQTGVQVAAAFDNQDNLLYELAVPLRLLYHHVPNLASSKQKAIVGVSFVGGRGNAAAGGSGNRSGSGNGMRGGGGMGGSGMRGGGGMGRGGMGGGGGMGRAGGGMQQGYTKPINLKTRVQLSEK